MSCNLVQAANAGTQCVHGISFGCYTAERTVWLLNGCRGEFICDKGDRRIGLCGLATWREQINCSCAPSSEIRSSINWMWWESQLVNYERNVAKGQLPKPPSNVAPWLPLRSLCPPCVVPNGHGHEPSVHLRRLLRAISITPAHGVFVDAGTSYEMADGAIALSLGFSVIGIEARRPVHAHIARMHELDISRANLTLIHAALADVDGRIVTIYNARDASSVLEAAATAHRGKYLEKSSTTAGAEGGAKSSERVATTTLDAIVGAAPCAAIKLDIQGSEYEALLGAGALLRRPPGEAPLLLFELMESLRKDLRDVAAVQLVRSAGYECYDVSSNLEHRLPDGSLRHQHRCCKQMRPRELRSARVKGADYVYDENIECLEWRDNATRACQSPLYTDFACVKPRKGPARLARKA